jgi:pilus assembly protein CpaC
LSAAIARGQMGEAADKLQLDLEVLSSIQVNLRVRVAEVSREVTRDLGFNWQALASVGDFAFGLRSGAAASAVGALASAAGGLGASSPSRFGAGLRTARLDVNAIIDALAADRLISKLAEPNLTAQSGETASFLAGGEFPVPVAATATGQITIEFKPFGVGLAFVPTVLGPGRLNLRVRPEVSELSDNGAIIVPLASGTVRIPALSVRRAETTVELGSGQSFAIAGLLQRSSTQVQDGVAGLGEVPVLGALFRSDRFRRQETELVIIVTPYLVRPVSDPRALAAPTDGFRPATDLDRVLRRRQVARGGPPPPPLLGRLDAGFLLD